MRKLRTRQHVLEDLSYNFVEKQVLLGFCTYIRYAQREYSYDASISTFDEKGELEPENILIQVKASDHLKFSTKNLGFELALDTRDIKLWLEELWPVLLILYDGVNDSGYFIELHEYFKENRLALKDLNKTKTIFISPKNVFTPQSVKEYRSKKNQIHGKIKKLQGDGTDLW
jgi:hypothetical protein